MHAAAQLQRVTRLTLADEASEDRRQNNSRNAKTTAVVVAEIVP